ncbi:MAG: hypothetical protein AB1601_01415 [Planctomycetota bacterium]
MLTASSSRAPIPCRRVGLAATLLLAGAATLPVLAGPSATVTCGQPRKDGGVTAKFYVWADAKGKHGMSYECEVTGIRGNMTPAQKAARIASELNACFKKKRAGIRATAAGPVVTVTDDRQVQHGVECTKWVDTTNEPTSAESAEIPGEFAYAGTARLDGLPTEGFALLVIDNQAALASTAVPSVLEVYQQWQLVLGGVVTPIGLLLEPRTGIGRTYFAFDLTDPGLDITVELVRLETRALVLGDTNCDGSLNFGDINPFVLMLTNPAAWQAAHPDCLMAVGDINGDGMVDFGDINEFVGLLAGS